MKVLVLLALVAFATAFDFPEDWESWKQVCLLPVLKFDANVLIAIPIILLEPFWKDRPGSNQIDQETYSFSRPQTKLTRQA